MQQKDIIFMIGVTFLLVLAWVGFSIYHSGVSSTISQSLSVKIAPISPGFDKKTIERIKKKVKITPIMDAQKMASQSTSPLINEGRITVSPTVLPNKNNVPNKTGTESAISTVP